MQIKIRLILYTFFLLILPELPLSAQEEEEIEDYEESLEDINRQLNNLLASIWSLVFQNNTSFNKGDLIDGTTGSNVLNFQPIMPIPIKSLNLITRPVIPLVTAPVLDPLSPDGVSGHKTGLGDITLLTLIGPSKPGGFIWGLGPTLILPTATKDEIGQGKWQLGPAALGLYLSKNWVVGVLAQQWWSFAGDDDRPDTSQLNAQYFIQRILPNSWQVGMSPNITADWEANNDNRWTVPIGLGVGKTFKLGKMPIKIVLEGQYSLVRPDNFGQEWNIRVQVTPVIPNPFAKR
jgi:hypothetical protein